MANPYLMQALYGPKPNTPVLKPELAVQRQLARESTIPTKQQATIGQQQALNDEPIVKQEIVVGEIASGSDGNNASNNTSKPFIAPNLTSPIMFNLSFRQEAGKVTEESAENTARCLQPSTFEQGRPKENAGGSLKSSGPRDFKEPAEHQTGQQQIHAARLQLMASKGELEFPKRPRLRRPKAWCATGSNVLPVGSKTEPESVSFRNAVLPAATPSLIATNGNDGSSSSSLHPAFCPNKPKEPTWWKPEIAPVRYLPPPGEYYDQHTLVNIFGRGYFDNELKGGSYLKCVHCWTASCVPSQSEWLQCKLPCGVCGTKNHPRKGCPMLYCSSSWHRDRGTTTYSDDIQLRPTSNEARQITQIGLIQPVAHNAIIVPVMSHPIAQRYYRDESRPQPLGVDLTQTDETSLSNPQIQPLTGPKLPSQSTPMVLSLMDNMLDPRLRNRKADGQIHAGGSTFGDPVQAVGRPSLSRSVASTEEDTASTMGSDFPPLNPMVGRLQLLDPPRGSLSPQTAHLNVRQEASVNLDSEIRIQDLEDQVLDLQRAITMKERDIRKLKRENEQLRTQGDVGHATGSKRPRIGCDLSADPVRDF